MKVVVVGGGLAGMTAAILLKDAGCQVELHEAKSRLGGRVGSYWDREGEKWVDYCQHVGMECCTHLVWWIDRFQQREYWDVCDRLHFVSPAGKKVTIRPLPLPAPCICLPCCGRGQDSSLASDFRSRAGYWP